MVLITDFVPALIEETKKGVRWKRANQDGVLTLKLRSYKLILVDEPEDNLIAVLKVKQGHKIVRQEIVGKDLWHAALNSVA